MAIKDLDRARYVAVKGFVAYLWHGRHTVNAWDVEGRCAFDCFSVGDFSRSEATLEEVMGAIEEHAMEQ